MKNFSGIKSMIFNAVIFCFIFFAGSEAFSANEYFRTINSGNWNNNSTWEMSTNSGSSWIAATMTPVSTSGPITIRNTHTVTVTADVSADQLTVDSSGILSINPGIALTILNGSSTDLTVTGTISGNGTLITSGTEVDVNLRGYANIYSALRIATGVADIREYLSPYTCRIRGNITIDTGASLYVGSSNSYNLYAFGTLTNNGSITGSDANLFMKGSSFIHNGVIATDVQMDSVVSYSGTGTYTATADYFYIGGTANVTLMNDATINPDVQLTMYSGAILNLNGKIMDMNKGTLMMEAGSSILNSGTFRTSGTVDFNIRAGSAFSAPLVVSSGTTDIRDNNSPYNARLYGSVTINSGAAIYAGSSNSFSLYTYGNVINNGTITGGSSNWVAKGPSFVHNGIIATDLQLDSVINYSGTGTYNVSADYISIGSTGNVTLGSNVNLSPDVEMTMYPGAVLNMNGKILDLSKGNWEMQTGSTVTNSGTFRTSNSVSFNLRTGSSFSAPLLISSGNAEIKENSPPYNARIYGTLTINSGATVNLGASDSYTLYAYGNIINNGLITGGSSNLSVKGTSFIHNGTFATDLQLDTNINYSGTGTYNSSADYVTVAANSTVTLGSDVSFSPDVQFLVNTGGVINPNSYTLTMTLGTLVLSSGATISNSGLFRTTGNSTLNIRSGSSFNAPLRIVAGTTTAYESAPPYLAKLNNNVTIDSAAVLYNGASGSYSLEISGNVINDGSISGNGNLIFTGLPQTLSGKGSITSDAQIKAGSTVNLTSNHSFKNITINTGSTFNITNRLAKFTESNPIIQNGAFTTTNSDVEYNGTGSQTISTTNISYHGLRINNPAGTSLSNNITIPDTIFVISGDLDLNTRVITLTTTGYLSETPGNTVKGNSGYITTTRSINSPSSLNVAGLGAVLTQASNLGSTEIRRGHAIQTGLNGGTSIRRYFDITPANNSGLNATLVFKYDDSEMNGKPEPSLKLFKSTNSGTNWLYQGGNVNIALNQITLSGITSFSRWSADSSKVSAAITIAIEGFYNTALNQLNMSDTVRAYLRNSSAPYAIVDSSVGILDSLTFKAPMQFTNAVTGSYYLSIKHRNSIETWSKVPLNYFQDSTLNYDFTFAAAQSYGNNTVLKGTKYCIYGGDITQDGQVSLADMVTVFNNSSSFINGYVQTDVTGDRITNLDDITLTYNNASKFISKKTP